MGLEFYIGTEVGAKRDMIIDFTIDGKYNFAILANQGLCASICRNNMIISIKLELVTGKLTNANNRKSFVDKYRVLTYIASRPIGTTMSLPF